MTTNKKDFKDTLLMMKTDFPMRGNLGVKEVDIQKEWEQLKLYQKRLEKNKNRTPFYLHDGPPYANGDIHVGHALNKILKDFIIRYKSMTNNYAPYIPGWDTHGLPIETALGKDKKVDRKNLSISAFRELCTKYALEQIDRQRVDFKRLGVLGAWDNPYLTLAPKYEEAQIKVFAQMVKKGLIFKGLKPVYWSPSSETALAEAEIEYYDVKSPAVYLAFKVLNGKDILSPDCELVIWTTTPWTIPANLAICVNPELDYVVVSYQERYFVVAKELVKSFTEKIGATDYSILKEIPGADLEGITYHHPLYDRTSPIILGDHVTIDAGTGLVHTAPGHGEDDFIVGRKYNLDILCPVDSRGYMTEEAGEFAGLFYQDANKVILKRLEEEKSLLHLEYITHSYPHDWRTKKPIIFRATPQWFASIEALKDDLLKAVHNVEWIPTWGEIRMTNMIKDRTEWCISRQRVWGVPIPAFYAEDGTAILDENIINHIATLFGQYGSNIWYDKEAKDLLPEGYTHPGSPNNIFVKETDTMDVWFDSGTSHQGGFVNFGGVYPADLYLEGSDQYRGWFNSSLSTGVALTKEAPYRTVLSHGFVLDGEGRKMSKSLGNVIDPQSVIREYGADILRLWVASVDYQSDVRISKDLLKQTSDAYRKIRNTFRFLLGNLFDFDPATDQVPYERLPEIDQYMECRLNEIIEKAHEAYRQYKFDEVTRTVLTYMSNDLSSFYCDFTKDILYIYEANAHARRSIQTVFYHHLVALTALLTPIIPHTTEEVYRYLPGEKEESIYLCDIPVAIKHSNSAELLKKYNQFLEYRDDVLKALEEARNNKVIGKSFNAHLIINPTPKAAKLLASLQINLQQVFIVSKCTIVDYELDAPTYDLGQILVEAADGPTCDRCWQIVDHVDDEGLCDRCHQIVIK